MSNRVAVELVRSPLLANKVPYCDAAVARDVARLVFTAGACPLDEFGSVVHVSDIEGQTKQAVRNLELALGAGGATLLDVVKTTIYVATDSRADLSIAWEVVERAFGDHTVPSTLVGVSVLGYQDQLVEIEAIAALSEPR